MEATVKVGRAQYGEIIGMKFAKLFVISYAGTRSKQRQYLCKCDCGEEVQVSKNNLIKSVTRSCGCIRHSGLKYAPKTGLFYRNGKAIVKATSHGYVEISYKGKRERGHRLAWKMIYGEIPKGMEIDHINRNRADNRICNLRLVKHADNIRNQNQPRRRSKFKGVDYVKHRSKWRARVAINNTKHHIGTYKTEIEAAIAYNEFLDSVGDIYAPRNVFDNGHKEQT